MGIRYFIRSKNRNKYIMLGITLVQVLFLVVSANSLNFTREVQDLYAPLHDKLAIIEKGTAFLEGLPMSSYLDISIYEELKADDWVGEVVAVYYERSGSSLRSNILLGVSEAKKKTTNPFQYATGVQISEGRFPSMDQREIAFGKETTYADNGVRVGDVISIADIQDILVTGSFEMGHFLKDRFVLMPLWLLQSVTGLRNRVNMIVVEPREGISLAELEAHVETKYDNVDALNDEERSEIVNEVLDTVNSFTYMIAAVSFAAGTILIISLTNLVLVQRFREMGIIKSLGAPNIALYLAVITENASLQLVSYFTGVIISYVILSAWTSFSLQEIRVTDILTVETLSFSFLVLFLSNTIGTILGGRHALQMSIIELMNK